MRAAPGCQAAAGLELLVSKAAAAESAAARKLQIRRIESQRGTKLTELFKDRLLLFVLTSLCVSDLNRRWRQTLV